MSTHRPVRKNCKAGVICVLASTTAESALTVQEIAHATQNSTTTVRHVLVKLVERMDVNFLRARDQGRTKRYYAAVDANGVRTPLRASERSQA